ncbi:MAG: hypothetical protein ACWIPI_10775 [Polaribacter sp.]
MKNLFLTLAFVFTTTFSFAGINASQASSKTTIVNEPDNGWVKVHVGCGNDFWLRTVDYRSAKELVATAVHFSKGRC